MPPPAANAVLQYDFKHNGERLLHMLRQHHPEYHPIVSIANIAHAAEASEDLETALRAHSTVLKYVEPELKAVEVNITDDRKRTINVSLFEDVKEIEGEQPENLLQDGQADDPVMKVIEAEVALIIEGGSDGEDEEGTRPRRERKGR